MSTSNNFTRSFQVNSAMSRGRIVTLSSNAKIGLAACDEDTPLGVLEVDTTAGSYENPKVRFPGTGTCMVSVTGCPLTAGDLMVIVTSGQVSVTNGRTGNVSTKFGILLESAATNGELKEVLPWFPAVT